jgi:protein RecA
VLGSPGEHVGGTACATYAPLGLIVVDSVAALVPKAEIEGEMGDSHMGLQARPMSQALRKLTGITHRTDTTIMFINQLRMKIGVMFGSPETTTGGHALKYYASVRLDIRRIGQLKNGDEVSGNRTRVKVVKNKLAPPSNSPSSAFSTQPASTQSAICSTWRSRTVSWKSAAPTWYSTAKHLHRGESEPESCWSPTRVYSSASPSVSRPASPTRARTRRRWRPPRSNRSDNSAAAA